MLQDPNKRPTETHTQKFLKYFSLFMTLVYPAFGIFILLSSPDQLALDKQTKVVLGIILIFYGFFRFYRTYERHFRNKGY